MRGIKSKNHNLITYQSNKTSTSCFVDKRYILDGGVNTLPYGHKDMPKSKKKKNSHSIITHHKWIIMQNTLIIYMLLLINLEKIKLKNLNKH